MPRFLYAVAMPAGYAEERVLEIVEDKDDFSPDLLAEPPIKEMEAKNERQAAAKIIRQMAAENIPINAIKIDTTKYFYEFSFYDHVFNRFPEIERSKYSKKKIHSSGHLS